jgi:hypothetical protein
MSPEDGIFPKGRIIFTRRVIFEMDIEIRNRAKQAICDLVTAEALKEVALVVLPNSDDCCSVGLDVQIVRGKEVSEPSYVFVGESNGWPVYLSPEVDRADSSLIINLDQTSDRLVALLLKRN